MCIFANQGAAHEKSVDRANVLHVKINKAEMTLESVFKIEKNILIGKNQANGR